MKSAYESLWMLFAAVLMSFGNVLVKYASADYHFWELTLWRSFVGMLFAWALLRSKGMTIWTKHPMLHTRRTIAGTISALFGTLGISLLPIGTAQTFGSMAALFIGGAMVVHALLHRRRPEWGLLAALVCGFAGILVILDPSFSADMIGGAMASLGCSLFGAIAYWTISELGSHGEPGTRIVFWFMFGGVVAGIAGGLLFGFSPWNTKSFAAMLGAGVFFGTMQMAMTRAWARGHLLISGTLQFTNIAFAVILGMIIFHDQVSLRTGLGIAIVTGSGIAATLLRLSRKA